MQLNLFYNRVNSRVSLHRNFIQFLEFALRHWTDTHTAVCWWMQFVKKERGLEMVRKGIYTTHVERFAVFVFADAVENSI